MQMAGNHKSSASLVAREIQIKGTLRLHWNGYRSNPIANAVENGEREALVTIGGSVG